MNNGRKGQRRVGKNSSEINERLERGANGVICDSVFLEGSLTRFLFKRNLSRDDGMLSKEDSSAFP